jgi:hypothetical protein
MPKTTPPVERDPQRIHTPALEALLSERGSQLVETLACEVYDLSAAHLLQAWDAAKVPQMVRALAGGIVEGMAHEGRRLLLGFIRTQLPRRRVRPGLPPAPR